MEYFVYVLLSQKDGMYYTGYTKNLFNRIEEHTHGKVLSTRLRLPVILFYWEGCLNQQDARREKYLKSRNGKIYLKNRLKNYFDNPTG